ncbi:hypothetical protein [Cellulomonas phragmiteti]|uniref:hypothetical protein n=1 Tax=Cellulomonas phragmiteti TaxID=478780 RepID=UPI001940B678|nr:hypothetical protein [Cellulomonas phragmiteti]
MSKLTAISRALEGHRRTFVGTTVASDFAHRNADAYDEVIEHDGDLTDVQDRVGPVDLVVSVMDADLAFSALAKGLDVLLVDSLLAFWQLERTPAEIADVCRRAAGRGYVGWQDDVGALTPHEQIYAAHLCATASVAQNFPGVPTRVRELEQLGAAAPRLSGAIIDHDAVGGAEGVDGSDVEVEPIDLLVNIGGFKNFLLDFDVHNEYLHLIERWVPDLVRAWPQLRRVVVCGGAYGGERGRDLTVGRCRVTFECKPQREFIAAMAATRHYLLTPGLTAIHEALAVGSFPLALPEEHVGHIANLQGLGATRFGRDGARFTDLVPGFEVPADDFHGTAAIDRRVGQLLRDDVAYAGFVDGMNARLGTYLELTDAEREAGVAELREMLSGPSFADVLRGVIGSLPVAASVAAV